MTEQQIKTEYKNTTDPKRKGELRNLLRDIKKNKAVTMITKENYSEKISAKDLANMPDAIKQGHEFFTKFGKHYNRRSKKQLIHISIRLMNSWK